MEIRKVLYATILFSILSTNLLSQHLEFNTKSFFGLWHNQGTEYFYNGSAIELLYEHPLAKGTLRTGLEYRSIDWGNQASLNLGYVLPHATNQKWDLNGVMSTGLGFALFRENPLFVWSLGYMPEIVFRKNKRINLSVGLGIRYTNSPGYKDFGSINQVLDFPFKIGLKFMGKKKKNSAD